jgi:hypothetical protein
MLNIRSLLRSTVDNPRSPYVQSFLAQVEDAFLRDILDGVIKQYQDVGKTAEQLFVAETERHDALPILRRGFIEQAVRSIAERHGLDTVTTLNEGRNCYHVEVRTGNVVITQSAVADPKTVVRHAIFREALAIEYQLLLFDDSQEKPNEARSLYAVLIHAADPKTGLPGFVHIAFPSQDLSRWVGRLDLLGYFGMGAQALAAPVDPTKPSPKIKKTRTQRGKNQGTA